MTARLQGTPKPGQGKKGQARSYKWLTYENTLTLTHHRGMEVTYRVKPTTLAKTKHFDNIEGRRGTEQVVRNEEQCRLFGGPFTVSGTALNGHSRWFGRSCFQYLPRAGFYIRKNVPEYSLQSNL